jgi:hypothetical protein
MANPWCDIPLADYEGHMDACGQLGPLADLFAAALAHARPASVAILGIAGGNGLEAVDPRITRRVAGIDINPAYLEAVAQRYGALPGLELHCADLAAGPVDILPADLVHAALIFEHSGAAQCLDHALALVASGGRFSAVLQLPSEIQQGVAATGFASIQSLAARFSFVAPAWLTTALAARGYALEVEQRCPLPGGKAFWLGVFGTPS